MESELQEAIHEARDLRRRLTESEAEKLQLQRENSARACGARGRVKGLHQLQLLFTLRYCELEADCEM
eukprot:UN18829